MSSSAESRPVEVHIEELIVEGFPPGDREVIAAAVRSRLAALLTDRGLPGSFSNDAQVASADAGQVELPSGTPPRSVGNQVAEALYRGLRR